MTRTDTILSRWPQHLEAARPHKRLYQVVDALAADLDLLASALAGVRRAHRLADADELADLWRLAALLGMGAAEFEVLLGRWRRAGELLAALQASIGAGDDAAREAAAAALAGLWSINALQGGAACLPLFADPAAPADSARAAARLADQARQALRRARLNDAVRQRIAGAAAVHAHGNGSVGALLQGAAVALDAELGEVMHSADRYWHAARIRDRLALAHAQPTTPPAPPGTVDVALAPADELIGLEENPLWRDATDNLPRRHGERFTATRRGFERALLQVRVTGEGQRTFGPMLVNRDEGHGIGFVGQVPAGQVLVFNEDGRVLLEGADVTALAYAWHGACFADADAPASADAVWVDAEAPAAPAGATPPPARFVTTVPASAGGEGEGVVTALDREARFPTAGASISVPGIGVGVTRLAFFVQQAHFASRELPAPRAVTPRTGAALFDGALFAGPPAPEAAAQVALSWLEHRAFAVRLLIPPRFARLRAEADAALTLQAVARAVERFRPLGVALAVEFIDDRWTLGSGSLTSGEGDDPIESLRAGMRLWPAPAAADDG